MAGAFDLIIEKRDGNLHVDARAIAGFPIGIDRAAVPHRFQRVDAIFHDFTAFLAIDGHDKTHAA